MTTTKHDIRALRIMTRDPLSEGRIRPRVIGRLIKRGLIAREGSGYRITDAGWDAILAAPPRDGEPEPQITTRREPVKRIAYIRRTVAGVDRWRVEIIDGPTGHVVASGHESSQGNILPYLMTGLDYDDVLADEYRQEDSEK